MLQSHADEGRRIPFVHGIIPATRSEQLFQIGCRKLLWIDIPGDSHSRVQRRLWVLLALQYLKLLSPANSQNLKDLEEQSRTLVSANLAFPHSISFFSFLGSTVPS